MRIPDSLASLADYGIIEEVLRPLMSGKEAQIYLVMSGGEKRVAKVYKEAQDRTFKNRAEYTEGRKVRNSRDQRAMGRNSRHGRAQAEAAWRATEVDVIYRLRAAGVRVPIPYHFIDSVLVMEMITDGHGNPAPRLGDLTLEPHEAQAVFDRLLAEVVRMLAAGIVHGDLSDFNVLMDPDGPVVIDFPQAVDASSNQNARKLLLRDVDNLHRFMTRVVPNHRALPYAQELWQLYERGRLGPDTRLTGVHRASERKVSATVVLDLIGDAAHDERRRREGLGLALRGVSDVGRRDRPQSNETPRRDRPQPNETPRRDRPQSNETPRRDRPQSNDPPRHADTPAGATQTGRERPRRVEVVLASRERHAQHQRPNHANADTRTTEGTTHHAQQPRPTTPAAAQHPPHAPNPRGAQEKQPETGVQGPKRRRRRRRRKPGEGAPKTPDRGG